MNCFTLKENGMLIVYLNNRIIHQGLIVCDAGPVSIDLNPIDLVEGRDILEFEIDKGKYVLEQVTLDGDIGQESIPNYVFTIKLQDTLLLEQGAHVGLNMIFDEPGYRKLGTIVINGFPLYLDTSDVEEFFDLTPFIKDGQNVIRIIPETQFSILSFDVFLE